MQAKNQTPYQQTTSPNDTVQKKVGGNQIQLQQPQKIFKNYRPYL